LVDVWGALRVFAPVGHYTEGRRRYDRRRAAVPP